MVWAPTMNVRYALSFLVSIGSLLEHKPVLKDLFLAKDFFKAWAREGFHFNSPGSENERQSCWDLDKWFYRLKQLGGLEGPLNKRKNTSPGAT